MTVARRCRLGVIESETGFLVYHSNDHLRDERMQNCEEKGIGHDPAQRPIRRQQRHAIQFEGDEDAKGH